MKKILGLDLGTNSIGWALIEQDFEEKQGRILGMGSRIIPMGTDKLDYEKGIGITKNADRRTQRTVRKMNKRYKLRRNKLLFILNELGMLPGQFQFKNGIPEPTKLQELELLPIKKGTMQLDSLQHYKLRVDSITKEVSLKEFGKILYQFNQRRGYAGGNNNEEENNKKKAINDDEEIEKKKYEVITQKVIIINVEKSDRTFKIKAGKNKGQELFYYDVTVLLDDEEKTGSTILQILENDKEEELEIRIKQTKKGEVVTFALPQKTSWRKQMEATEEILKKENLYIGQLLLRDLEQNKWKRIRNRVILRQQYQKEFDAIWDMQSKYYPILNDCKKEKLERIVNYLYPGEKQTQADLRNEGIAKGLKHIIRNQVIYYQRPLKLQTELISKCKFEKEEKVLPTSHPLFQEFRCWDQINRLFITTKVETFDQKKNKTIYRYFDRYLTNGQKNTIYLKLQTQKQVGFNEIAKIVNLKTDRTEYLNGLNVKAKLKGCDTLITIKNKLGNTFEEIIKKDKSIVEKIWSAIYNNTGNEYDETSPKVSALIKILNQFDEKPIAIEYAFKLAQSINYPRKYTSLSAKAINNIVPLMVCEPLNISDDIKEKYGKIKRIIDTGEIGDDNLIEPYMIDYIYNNPNIIENGGMMFAFAASLIYSKHTTNNVGPTITNYHQIIYDKNRNLRNPIVEQLLNETMQVIKALWKQYKLNPQELEIRVELARELKNSAIERENIYKNQLNNQRYNETIKIRLQENNIQITDENILKYKLYEQQKYISPYSGDPLEISGFNDYQIDHIIPKSRLFDDSFANKVLVEGFLNAEKSNRTAWEYITQQKSDYKICSIEKYIKHVNDNFFGKKKKNLLLEKIPNNFVERQIKETQYISVAVKNELSKIVGTNNVKTTTGEITSFLRSRWGLRKLFMELTEDRFKRMELWDSSIQWVKKYFSEKAGKNVYEIEHWNKRYDHRHHSLDALTVALTDQGHVQRLNNLNKELQDWLLNHQKEIDLSITDGESAIESFFSLEEERRIKIQENIESFRRFDPPISNLISQAKEHLETMIVSQKPKDSMLIQFNEKSKKKELKIRGALHEATLYGKHNGQDTKTIPITNLAVTDINKIVDKSVLKKEIEEHRNKKDDKGKNYFESMKEAFSGEGLKNFNDERVMKGKPPVYKLKLYYSKNEDKESSLQQLYSNNEKLSVKTGGNYLFMVMQKMMDEECKRVFDIITLYDAARIAKKEWQNKNQNFKAAIYKDCLEKNNAEKILFSLQQNELVYLPTDVDDPVLGFISNEELEEWIAIKSNKIAFSKNVFKVVKFTGKDCFFIPNNYAQTISISKDLTDQQKDEYRKQYGEKKIPKKILNYEEFGTYGTSTRTEVNEHFIKSLVDKDYKQQPRKIQDTCIKIYTDWLGYIRLFK
jgi:CRISPR-associated endonuclease Csn1